MPGLHSQDLTGKSGGWDRGEEGGAGDRCRRDENWKIQNSPQMDRVTVTRLSRIVKWNMSNQWSSSKPTACMFQPISNMTGVTHDDGFYYAKHRI